MARPRTFALVMAVLLLSSPTLLASSIIFHLCHNRHPDNTSSSPAAFLFLACPPMSDALLDEAHTPVPPSQPAIALHPFAPANPKSASRHAHFAFTLCTIHTEVVLTSHSTHLFVLVTQSGKLGSLLTASLDSSHLDLHPSVEPTFLCQTHLGSRPHLTTTLSHNTTLSTLPTLYSLLARQLIAALVAAGAVGDEGERKVVLCISLKPECVERAAQELGGGCGLQAAGMAVVRTLMERIKEADVW